MENHLTEDIIRQKLNTSFKPQLLEITNESGKHKGHSQHKGAVPEETGETHFRIHIIAEIFRGMKREERHRAVYHVLDHEMRNGVHAVGLKIEAPGEGRG